MRVAAARAIPAPSPRARARLLAPLFVWLCHIKRGGGVCFWCFHGLSRFLCFFTSFTNIRTHALARFHHLTSKAKRDQRGAQKIHTERGRTQCSCDTRQRNKRKAFFWGGVQVHEVWGVCARAPVWCLACGRNNKPKPPCITVPPFSPGFCAAAGRRAPVCCFRRLFLCVCFVCAPFWLRFRSSIFHPHIQTTLLLLLHQPTANNGLFSLFFFFFCAVWWRGFLLGVQVFCFCFACAFG